MRSISLFFSSTSFTLIELLVVVAIVAILATVAVIVLNPIEMIKAGRDSVRLSDLANINSAINILQSDLSSAGFGSTTVVYVSLPDTSSVCANLGLPSLPSGWVYNCVQSSVLQNTDGTGWIPINFQSFSGGTLLSRLPIDPVNTTSSNLYYSYIVGSWKLSAGIESQKYRQSSAARDLGVDTNRYEIGSDIVCGGFVTDYEGNIYPTVRIGTQCWIASHLYTKYKPDGTLFTNSILGSVTTSSERTCPAVNGTTTPGSESDCVVYGALYTWAAAMNGVATEGVRGICPVGWHMPSDTEYKTLEMNLGMSQAEADATSWRGTHNEGNQIKLVANCTGGLQCGTSGFNSVLAGSRNIDGVTFISRSSNATLWTSSPFGGTAAWTRYLGSAQINRAGYNRLNNFSVRCLKDSL